MMSLIQAVPEFVASLDDAQKRVLAQCVKRENSSFGLRWFWASVTQEQMKDFERAA